VTHDDCGTVKTGVRCLCIAVLSIYHMGRLYLNKKQNIYVILVRWLRMWSHQPMLEYLFTHKSHLCPSLPYLVLVGHIPL
jgi:hypothetical protein